MKLKQKIDLIPGIIYLLIGTLYLLLPLYHITNIKNIIIISFIIISLASLTQFIINKNTKDYSGLYSLIVDIVLIGAFIYVDIHNPRYLSMVLLGWVALTSLIKLKKSDYYHDRRDKMWKINIIMLIIFIFTGILTSIHLHYADSVKLIIIGYYLIINGILETMDPIVKGLIK